jgi:hypothetical protein
MRHFVLALMIVLLPLRGWVGDAMAMQMSAGALEATAVAAQKDTEHVHCLEQASSSEEAAPATADCNTCTSCQICHSIALTPTLLTLATVPMPVAQPQAGAPLFASAERALGFKPPIS